jgi:hypothetical protein
MRLKDKLLVLFDFYMYCKFGEDEYAMSGCAFEAQVERGHCIDLCGRFMSTGCNCPCNALGSKAAFARLERVMIQHKMIEQEVS